MERRQRLRRTVDVTCYAYVNNERIKFKATNLSAGGVFLKKLKHNCEIKRHTVVRLIFVLHTNSVFKVHRVYGIFVRENAEGFGLMFVKQQGRRYVST